MTIEVRETEEQVTARYRREYSERKARRMARASQNAQLLGIINVNGSRMEIRRAMRSRGASSHYKQVPCYWIIQYTDGKLVCGRSLTEKAYQEGKEYALKHNGIRLP